MSGESIVVLFVSAVLINNIVLSKFLGLCPFFGVSKKLSSAIGMGVAANFVIILASFITWIFYNFILIPLELTFLRIITFILIISTLVQFIELFLRKKSPALYKSLGIYLPLITTNCAILGTTFLIVDYKYNFSKAMVFSFGTGIGFFLALLLFASIRDRLETAPIPESFRGYGIIFITVSLMSLAFMGFSGFLRF